MASEDRELAEYLARIRKTIADSERMVSQAELRIAETDRMLESQGLTREQVMAMRFSDAQMEAVNAELKRRGMDPLEKWSMDGAEAAPGPLDGYNTAPPANHDMSASDAELENRQRKFGLMMKPFQL